MNTIHSIKIKQVVDECADLSHLGEYSNEPGKNCVDRKERGDMGRNEFRYFNAAMSAEETGNPDSVEQDYQRFEAYNRGDWNMVGVIAVAVVSVNTCCQKIYSGGLWGIESDSEKEYFDEVAAEQRAELDEILKALGFAAAQEASECACGGE